MAGKSTDRFTERRESKTNSDGTPFDRYELARNHPEGAGIVAEIESMAGGPQSYRRLAELVERLTELGLYRPGV
jgi:hypothetical protein